VVFLHTPSNDDPFTAFPAGFEEVQSIQFGVNLGSYGIFAKEALGTEDGTTVTFASPGARRSTAYAVALENADEDVSNWHLATPVTATSGSTTPSSAAITTTTNDNLLFASIAGAQGMLEGATTFTAGSGWTEESDQSTAVGVRDTAHTVASRTQAAPGTVAGVAFTTNLSLPNRIATTIGIPYVETILGPLANAGPDQTGVTPGATVTLDGSGSSTGVGTLDYLWTQTAGAAVVLSSTTVAGPTFTAPAGPDTLTFQLQVTDDNTSDSDLVTVSVDPSPSGLPTSARIGAAHVTAVAKVRVSGSWV
jgi:hypothetical protein